MPTNILNLPTEETLQSIATALSNMQGNVSGVKGNEETTYRTGQVNLTAANIGALPVNTVYVSSVNGGSGAVTGIATQQELDQVRSIAEGAGAAMSFSNYASMVSDFNSAADDDYKLGQSIYINTLNVPDLWIYEISDISILYYYTTDAAFTQLLSQQGYVQIGYYKVAALETQQVDLTNYVTLNGTQTLTGTKSFTDFTLINDYTNGKTLASYLSDRYTKTEADAEFVDITSDQTITGKKNIQELHVSSRTDYDWNFVPEAGGAALGIRQGTSSKLKLYTNAFSPSSDNSINLGYSSSLRWKNLYLAGSINPNSNNYGLVIPSTANYTANETIATTETITGYPTYTTTTYAVGDKVIYQNVAYRCKTAITTAEDFNSAHWQQIQLKDYVDLDTVQTVTGRKTFSAQINFTNNSGINVGKICAINGVGVVGFNGTYFYPLTDNAKDLGQSSYRWKDFYLAGNLTDGTNSISIANLSTLNTNQTITGEKTFKNTISFVYDDENYPTYKYKITQNSLYNLDFLQYGTSVFTISTSGIYSGKSFIPKTNNTYSLGSSTQQWQNMYLIGKINPNSNSYGLTLPDTINLTANETLATTENITGYAAYDNSVTYAVGDKVLYNNVGYRCKTAVSTAEDFDSAKWEVIQLKDYVDIDTNQVIKGTKTVRSIFFVKDTSNPSSGSKLEIQNDNGYNAKIRFNGYGFMFTANSVQPTGTVTMGTSSAPWSTMYMTNLSNGTNTATVANIISGEVLKNIVGYDATKTQSLKNINGTLTWVDD